MKSYTKGAKFERELVWEFWNSGWVAIRAAGSGRISLPVPDIIALKNEKIMETFAQFFGKGKYSHKIENRFSFI